MGFEPMSAVAQWISNPSPYQARKPRLTIFVNYFWFVIIALKKFAFTL